MSLETTPCPYSHPGCPLPAARRTGGGFSSKKRRNGRNQAANKGSGGGRKAPRKPCCVVCGSDEAKYKCPKCREPYCKVACCREHKGQCPALSKDIISQKKSAGASSAGGGSADDSIHAHASPSPAKKRSKYLPSYDALSEDPLENAVCRRRMLDEDSDSDEELEPGWRISRDMMDRIDGSSWLRGELADGGLRRMVAEIDAADDEAAANKGDRNGRSWHPRSNSRRRRGGKTAQCELSPRELALERAKRDNPNFANFIDRLLLTAGVLKRTIGDDAGSIEQVLLGGGNIGGLVLAPQTERAKKPSVKKEDIDEDASEMEDDESSSDSDSSDESCTSSSTESSDE